MATVELRTLGECQVVLAGGSIGPQSPYAFALALYLCVERGRAHGRDELLPIFFPGVSAEKAAHSLRQSIYKLRKLGLACESTQAGTIVPAGLVRDDFASLLATSQLPDLAGGRLPGEFLPGYWPKISPAFTQWLESQRDAVNSALRRAYIAQIGDRRAVARWDQVEKYARACLQIDPLNEEATLALAESLALTGSKAAGMKLLDEFIEEVGGTGSVLTLPASTLRRRISERVHLHCPIDAPPFIGREREMGILNRAYALARSGTQSSVLLHGEPGIGKTRLLKEFTGYASLTGCRVVHYTCQSHDEAHTLGPFSDIVRRLLTVPGAIGCDDRTLTMLRTFAGDPADATASVRRPSFSVQQLATALNDLLDALTEEHMLLIAIDDVQWIDRMSIQILATLIHSDTKRRLVVAMSSRNAPQELQSCPPLHQFRVEGLLHEHAVEFLRHSFSSVSVALRNDLIRRAAELGAGNPFYLQILVDHFLHHPDPITLPERLKELVGRKVDAVSVGAKTVLTASALLGRHSSIARIEAVLQIPRFQLCRELGALHTTGLVVWNGDHIAVSHCLITEALLGEPVGPSFAVVCSAVGNTLEADARTSGAISMYLAARACWSLLSDSVGIARCSRDVETLDALTVIMTHHDSSKESLHPQFDVSSAQPYCGRVSDAGIVYDLGAEPSGSAGQPDLLTLGSDGPSLLKVATDMRNSPATRLRAAVSALSVAETMFDAADGKAAFNAAEAARQDAAGHARADWERAVFAYHTTFGDKSVALALAADIEHSGNVYGGMDITCRAERNAAEALSRCGEGERSLRLYDKTFKRALSCGLIDSAAGAASHAMWIARQFGCLDQISMWRDRTQQYMAKDMPYYPNFVYNEALLALSSYDWSVYSGRARELEHLLRRSTNAHHCALKDALLLSGYARDNNSAIDAELVRQLRTWSMRNAQLIPDDDVAIAVARALSVLESAATAKRFLTAFLRVRRNRTFPVLNHLTDYLATL